jgi:hypothetical protein
MEGPTLGMIFAPASGALISTDDPLIGGLVMLPLIFLFYKAVLGRYVEKRAGTESRTQEVIILLSKGFLALLVALALFGIGKGLYRLFF